MLKTTTLAFSAVLLLTSAAYAEQARVKAEAEWIKDGDTPLIEIRMYGIDTPEKDQKCEGKDGSCYRCGKRATRRLIELLHSQKADYVFTGETTYGRPVATIYQDGRDVNLQMVEEGWAVAYSRYLKGEKKKQYESVQAEAKKDKRGIWQGKFIMPDRWRRGDRLPCE